MVVRSIINTSTNATEFQMLIKVFARTDKTLKNGEAKVAPARFKVGTTGRVWEYGGAQMYYKGQLMELQDYRQLPNVSGESSLVKFGYRNDNGFNEVLVKLTAV